jgi:hypothetical protein
MPKIKSAKNAAPKRIGQPVELQTWLVEMETTKDKDGNPVTRRKNLSDTLYDEIKDGKITKDKDGKVTSIVSPSFTLTVEVAKRRIPANKDGQPYEMEYASLLPNVIEACALLVGGNTDVTVEKDKDGNEKELPSVTKYFRQGYGMLARNNASAQIASAVEGPDKAFEQAVKALMKAKGWSEDKAREKAKLMMED